MKKIDKILEYFRNIREDSPTMNTGGVPGSPGFSGSAKSEGPVAGFDPVIGFKKRSNGKIDGRTVNKKYKDWMKSLGLL